MSKRFYWFIGAAMIVGGVAPMPALAVPTLQLHIEDAKYYDSYVMDDGLGNTFTVTESWFTDKNPFILNVVSADSPQAITHIGNVKLIMSVQSQFWQTDGSIAIKGTETDTLGINKVIKSTDFTNGMPDPFGDKNFPPHGIFPAYYYVLDLPDLQVNDLNQRENIYDYNKFYVPGVSSVATVGDIQRYEIFYYSFYHVHFDLVGTAYGKNNEWADGKNKIAPFSHDADAPPGPSPPPAPIPEPGTLLLLGSGLIGLAMYRHRKSKV